jgi:hypothetical protein
VVKNFLAVIQDCNWRRLLFGNALFFGVCYGVATAFFFTYGAWFHAETDLVWLWKHVPFVFSSQEFLRTAAESVEQQ